MIKKYITRVEKALESANSNISKLSPQTDSIVGTTTKRIRTVLNELVSYPNVRYLEIGVQAGATFVSANYGNKPEVSFCIDNWCQGNGSREQIFIDNCKNNNITYQLFKEDCFNLKPETKAQIKDINVYFYDAEHFESNHYNALIYYLECLSSPCIVLIDDWNHIPTREGTKRAVSENKFAIHKKWELESGEWWNGLCIMVISKSNKKKNDIEWVEWPRPAPAATVTPPPSPVATSPPPVPSGLAPAHIQQPPPPTYKVRSETYPPPPSSFVSRYGRRELRRKT